MESKIDAAFSGFDQKLHNIEAQVTTVEQHPLAYPESPSTSGSSSSEDRKRKRCIPPELQVCEAIYFDSFPLCNCLHSFRFVLFIPPLMMTISSIGHNR